MSNKKIEARIKDESQRNAILLFCCWVIGTYLYFLLVSSLWFAIFTNLLHVFPSWLSYGIGFVFGFFVSKGFFPIGFANDLLKHHWQFMQKYRISLTKPD